MTLSIGCVNIPGVKHISNILAIVVSQVVEMEEKTTDGIRRISYDLAWDNIGDEKKVLSGIEMLKQAGFNLKHHIGFYVLVGYNTTHEQDLYRCWKLKEAGTNAFVMQFKQTPLSKHLARWANRRELFWSIDFDDYTRAKKTTRIHEDAE